MKIAVKRSLATHTIHLYSCHVAVGSAFAGNGRISGPNGYRSLKKLGSKTTKYLDNSLVFGHWCSGCGKFIREGPSSMKIIGHRSGFLRKSSQLVTEAEDPNLRLVSIGDVQEVLCLFSGGGSSDSRCDCRIY
ncbi:hypothetical protein ACH5RR_040495 [Cinchona calisaya]|uniref:Uncharacterized protein n=1 Tax=Cinchona calisaya TaxID=153742 RepID=A0ABD2XW91_9GENT